MNRSLLIICLLIYQFGFGQTNTWDGSSSATWNTAANWSLNLVPTAAHDVVIPDGITVTIDVNTAAVCNTFRMNTGGTANTVSISGSNSLTVSGAITIEQGTGKNKHKILAVNAGNLSAASITMNSTGGDNRYCRLSISTGTVNVTGNIIMNDTDVDRNQVTFTAGGTLNIGGAMSGGGLTPSTGTVNYNNNVGPQTVGTYIYNNLTLSGSGTKTAAGNLTVNGTLTNGSGVTLNMATNQLLGTLGTITNAGTIRTQNTSATPIPTAKNWGGTIQYDGAGQTVSTGIYNNLTLSGSGGKTFPTGTTTVNGILSIENGNSVNTFTGSLAYGSTSTLQYNTGTARTAGAEWPSIFAGTGGVVIKNIGVITLNNAKTINNRLSIETSAKVNLDAFTHTSNGLTLGGTNKPFGSWGHSISVAPNKDDVFFASAIGIINVSESTCVNNLITNGDFTNAGTGFDLAYGWTYSPTKGTYVETYPEDTYFTTGNGGFTAELDAGASLRQTVTLVPGVSYTLSFIYARRPGPEAPSTSGVRVDVREGVMVTSTTDFSTLSSTPQIGSFTFTPTSASITLDFYNHLAIGQTYGTIIDNIVLVPSSQVTPFATTIPKGIFNTLISCAGTPVQLDVDKVQSSGLTYVWTGSTGTTFSSTNIKNPIVTFTGTGLQQATVAVTTAAGCIASSSTYVNLKNLNGPTITTAATAAVVVAVCQSASVQATTMAYTATTNTPTSYRIDWATLVDQGPTSTTFSVGGGSITNISVPAGTAAGTYTGTLIITNANCSSTKAITMTVNPYVAVSSQSTATQTQCVATAFTPISVSATGVGLTYQWYSNVANSNSGGTSLVATNGAQTNSYTPQSTVARTLYYYCIVSGTCGTAVTSAVSGAFITNPGVATPTVSKVDVSCSVSAGSITVNTPVPSASVSYSIDGIDYSNTTGKFTGLSANTFTVYAKDTSVSNGCDVSPGFTIIISGTDVVNTYKAGLWSLGEPQLSQILVFDADYTSSGTVNGCSCEVNSGKNVTISTGDIMTITNSVNGPGTIVFENNASLIQVNDAAVNTGNITYKRISAPMKNFDFTYWSSPVENQIMNVLSPNTLSDKYFSFAGNDWVYEAGSSPMVPARGYIIRVPKPNFWPVPSALTYPQPVEFKGKPNNGIQSFVAEATGSYNLIGNPYPSAVDAKLFLEANSSVLKGTLYYWTHTTAITPSGTFYEYNSDDYATYTLAGGVATKVGNKKPDGTFDDSKKPTDYIPAGKSFFVESLTAGTVNFKNVMRVSGNINQFSRFNTKTAKTNAIERHRVWLNLTNTQGLFKQMLVGYLSDATNEFDNSFDGESFDGNTFADFYSVNSNKNLTIQGRALPFDFSDQVPLGYRTTIVGELSIAIDSFEGLFGTADIVIEDKLVNVSHNLKSGPYTFTTDEGVFNDRFVLKYTDKTLGTDDLDKEKGLVIVSVKNKIVKLNSPVEQLDKVVIYDLLGKAVFKRINVNANELEVPNLNLGHQVLIVKTTLQNGAVVTNKIVY
jgi:hypothetical protein